MAAPFTPVASVSVAEQLDRAMTRNAVLIVLLRHNTARMHANAPGHGSGYWTACPHEDCRKVAVLLGDRGRQP